MARELISHSSQTLRRVATRYNCELDFCTYPCPWPPPSSLLTFLMALLLSVLLMPGYHCE